MKTVEECRQCQPSWLTVQEIQRELTVTDPESDRGRALARAFMARVDLINGITRQADHQVRRRQAHQTR